MVLTKPELIGSLQNEVRVLQHLITKIEPSMVDYRPTPGQRTIAQRATAVSLPEAKTRVGAGLLAMKAARCI